MRIYFAHAVTDYGTVRQEMAMAGLRHHFVDDLGRKHFEIENPDQPHHQHGYELGGMDYFRGVVESCDSLAFMRFPDGGIGAGVGREIQWALQYNLWVYEVFYGRVYQTHYAPTPILTVDATRAAIAHYRVVSKC